MSEKRGLRVSWLPMGRSRNAFSFRSAQELREAQAELEAGEEQAGDPIADIFRRGVLDRYRPHPDSEQ